jgi:hypothetical protein
VECNVSYSCVQDPNDIEGLESGADTPDIDGNISAVPQFYFEPSSFVYYLRSTSPCRDIGNNNSASGTGDYYGQTRIVNTTVDMGAVEYDGPQICEDCNFDDSAAVDFKDYLYFADSWLAEDTDQNYDIACDLYPDDVIDDGDLMEFAECWLWEPDFIDTDDIMRVAHRSTGLEAIEPIEMMGMMSLPTIFVEGRDGIFYEVPAPEPQIETAVVSPLSSKSKPLSVEAAEMATTVYLLDEIYENSPPLSEEEYQQYLQFRESLITGYYQLITPQ